MGLPPYGPEPYASANSATPASDMGLIGDLLIIAQDARICQGIGKIFFMFRKKF